MVENNILTTTPTSPRLISRNGILLPTVVIWLLRSSWISNSTLLSKWHWSFVRDTFSIWYNFLYLRFGDLKHSIICQAPFPSSVFKFDSLWWRDRCSIIDSSWMFLSISCKLGNGKLLIFWNCKWLGDKSFCLLFLDLYCVVAVLQAKVENLYFWNDMFQR